MARSESRPIVSRTGVGTAWLPGSSGRGANATACRRCASRRARQAAANDRWTSRRDWKVPRTPGLSGAQEYLQPAIAPDVIEGRPYHAGVPLSAASECAGKPPQAMHDQLWRSGRARRQQHPLSLMRCVAITLDRRGLQGRRDAGTGYLPDNPRDCTVRDDGINAGIVDDRRQLLRWDIRRANHKPMRATPSNSMRASAVAS